MNQSISAGICSDQGLRSTTASMASSGPVKEECFRPLPFPVKVEPEYGAPKCALNRATVVDISSSGSGSGSRGHGEDASCRHGDFGNLAGEVTSAVVIKRSSVPDSQIADGTDPPAKRPRIGSLPVSPTCTLRGGGMSLPHDFLQPLEGVRQNSPVPQAVMAFTPSVPRPITQNVVNKPFRQFWKAGDYESNKSSNKSRSGGMDHVRVHPKFLHSNATSHKWALGAVAELLDNALDEVVHGATFVQVDMIRNPKNGEPMLLIEDDGGGMNPDSMRQCMSLGYSAKSKMANTIGQYGNGFKTSTMRLGADVVVFSRCPDNKGLGPTESIGLLSYTFLRETGQEDIIVPMIDYVIQPFGLRKLIRSSVEDWNRNMESIKRWSPYSTEAELLEHFKGMKKQGTKIIVFNLWEDDQGQLELDFHSNKYDIQLQGVNRNENHISMANRFPNSRHYLTYQHSLRSYASILYLKLPPGFRMFLRGKEVEHHNLIDDLMFTEVWTYRPVDSDVKQRDNSQMKAVVTVGFVKDAKEHIDVQGFNVYHKNRLIKPFWRLWNSAASRGRGIIGVLEANFVEPAHDKQGFERTIVLARLESRLIEMQKTYWSKHCHKVGYVNNTLKGKEGKAAEHKGASSIVEAIQPAVVVPLALPPPARASVEASHTSTHVGYVSGAQNIPRPPGLARSTHLQTQVQLARPEHAVKEVNPQVPQQVSLQGDLLHSASGSTSYHRPNMATRNSMVPASLSPVQMACTQQQQRPSGQFHSAIRSPLPPPAALSRVSNTQPAQMADTQPQQRLSIQFQNATCSPPVTISRVSNTQPSQIAVAQPHEQLHGQFHNVNCSPLPSPTVINKVSNSQAESVRAITAFSGAAQTLGLAQIAAIDCVSPAVRTTQSSSSNMGGLLSSAQNQPVCSANSRGGARAQLPGPDVETERPAVGSPHSPHTVIPQENAVAQSFAIVPANEGVDSHALEYPNSSTVHVIPSTQNVSMTSIPAVEESRSPEAAVCVAEDKEQQHMDGQNRLNGQTLPKAITCSASKSQTREQESVEVSVQGESYKAKGAYGAAHVPSSPHASHGNDINVAQVAKLPPEHGSLKTSRHTNKEPIPGRKSLEDLGRLFARKAASINMNQAEQSKQLKVSENECTESGLAVGSIVKSGSNKELEVRLMEMELEVKDLQYRLDALTAERDSLRHQLLEERLQGQLIKQELQRRVEQTWAKVRKLEAQNGRSQLIQEGNAV